MKKPLLILALMFLAQNMTFAEERRGKGKRFEENKGRILENIGKKIGFLSKFKSCITSATSIEQLKSCRKANKIILEEFRAAKKASKEERKRRRAESE